LPDFSGKCVSFTLIDESACNDINDPIFEYQGGRLFVVGTIPKGATTSDWAAGALGAVAWNRVTDYIVFETEEAFIKATKISETHINKESGSSED
jgi:hypothetical protein